jgi:hypothetical protein
VSAVDYQVVSSIDANQKGLRVPTQQMPNLEIKVQKQSSVDPHMSYYLEHDNSKTVLFIINEEIAACKNEEN